MPRFFRAPPRIPTRTEVDAVLRVTDAHARDHLLVAVAAGTGLRVHELVALDWEQLVSDSGAVRHRVHLRAEDTKGNVGGDVVLNEALRWKVARYRTWCARRGHAVDGDAPVFVSRNHRRLSVRMTQEAWRAAQGLAGIERPYPFHALRHYFGTALYKATKDQGPDPMNGRGNYVDADGKTQRVLCHGCDANPHAHVNNPAGERLDIDGNVVPPESPEAHLPIGSDREDRSG